MGEPIPPEPPEPPPAENPCVNCGIEITPSNLLVYVIGVVPCLCTPIAGIYSFEASGSIDMPYVVPQMPGSNPCFWWKSFGPAGLHTKFYTHLDCTPPISFEGDMGLEIGVKKNADGTITCCVSSDAIPPGCSGYRMFLGTAAPLKGCMGTVIANELICYWLGANLKIASGGMVVITPY